MSAFADLDHAQRAAALPLEDFNVGDPALFESDVWEPYFRRLRDEAPVHFCRQSEFGPYWSITRYEDIVKVDVNHKVFSSSSKLGGFTIRDLAASIDLPAFISMDPPKHDEQRKVVQPIVAPANLQKLEATIRAHAIDILNHLPRGETFDWVDHVSVELTARMLATLMDFPFALRRKLVFWSDAATVFARPGEIVESEEQRAQVMRECFGFFMKLWNDRVNADPKPDLISMLAHGAATRNMPMMEYLGNVLLLIVGGNDTTRNAISGGALFLHRFPEEFEKVRKNRTLIDSMVPEIIRYQTPISHMRRTATADYELNGQTIKAGDKVIMWYISGNRDERAIENPDAFRVDRPRPREHLSFGFGIHRCVGNRLAELQLKILWEEILARFSRVEVVGAEKRVYGSFVHGILELPVRVHD